jgi:RNA polymerase sigma-70 factor (TIGR02957 family)
LTASAGASEELLDELRPVAFAMGYRMLGSVTEAEDVAQEALLRLHRALEQGEEIASPRAYLATVATRLAIDELRSARVRRERYVGDWLPEPLVSEARPEPGPAEQAEMADSLSLAFLVVLESLTPEQRAALLLHDVFDYGYDEVARILGTSVPNARQLASRARRHVGEGRPRFQTSREHREALAHRFLAAAQEGDMGALESILAADVELHGDGGGKAPALARPLHGRTRVARAFANWTNVGRRAGFEMKPAWVNGEPGLVATDGEGRLAGVIAFAIAGEEIRGVYSVVNPDKLSRLGPLADVRAMLRTAAERRSRGDKQPG